MRERKRRRLGISGALCLYMAGIAGAVDAAGSASEGRKKAAQCAACHGTDGLSRRPDVPHIAGQSEIYLEEQLRRYRSGERVHPEMNVVAKRLADRDIEDLVAWYSSIRVEVELPE